MIPMQYLLKVNHQVHDSVSKYNNWDGQITWTTGNDTNRKRIYILSSSSGGCLSFSFVGSWGLGLGVVHLHHIGMEAYMLLAKGRLLSYCIRLAIIVRFIETQIWFWLYLDREQADTNRKQIYILSSSSEGAFRFPLLEVEAWGRGGSSPSSYRDGSVYVIGRRSPVELLH